MRDKAKSKKTPSRKKYEEEHPTISFRLDKDTRKCLEEHLQNTGCSFANFTKGALGKEKEMVDKRIEMLASEHIEPSVEDRLRCLEDLTHQVILKACVLAGTEDDLPPCCPHCDRQKLIRAEGREMESSLANPWVTTWKCPKCGFFIDTYKRIDPKSIAYV